VTALTSANAYQQPMYFELAFSVTGGKNYRYLNDTGLRECDATGATPKIVLY